MAKDKIIPTWLKVATLAALFVPYSVKLDKDEDKKIKKVSAKSLATHITYTPADGDKESELGIALFGGHKEGARGKKIHVNTNALRNDLGRFCDKASVKVKDCAKKVAEVCDKYVVVEKTDAVSVKETDDVTV